MILGIWKNDFTRHCSTNIRWFLGYIEGFHFACDLPHKYPIPLIKDFTTNCWNWLKPSRCDWPACEATDCGQSGETSSWRVHTAATEVETDREKYPTLSLACLLWKQPCVLSHIQKCWKRSLIPRNNNLEMTKSVNTTNINQNYEQLELER